MQNNPKHAVGNAASLPDWLQTEENYTPKKDSDGFITKSILTVISILSCFRNTRGTDIPSASAPVKLFSVLYFILLISCSRNMFFSYCMLAGMLVCFCLLPNQALLRAISASLSAAVLSLFLLLPAAFLGSPHAILTVSSKVFVSVGLINLLAATTPWNHLTEGLRVFHIPNLFIFTFDITLKYIVVLGDVCVYMLQALRLRSVGKNQQKSKAFSGILGVTFLKSREMAEEMYQAMICRGFEGEYRKPKQFRLQKKDFLFLALFIAVTILFFYLERSM